MRTEARRLGGWHCRRHLKGQMGERGTRREQGWQVTHEDTGLRTQPSPCRPEGWVETHWVDPRSHALPWCVGRETLPDGPGQEGPLEKMAEPAGLCSCPPCCAPLRGGRECLPPGALLSPVGLPEHRVGPPNSRSTPRSKVSLPPAGSAALSPGLWLSTTNSPGRGRGCSWPPLLWVVAGGRAAADGTPGGRGRRQESSSSAVISVYSLPASAGTGPASAPGPLWSLFWGWNRWSPGMAHTSPSPCHQPWRLEPHSWGAGGCPVSRVGDLHAVKRWLLSLGPSPALPRGAFFLG